MLQKLLRTRHVTSIFPFIVLLAVILVIMHTAREAGKGRKKQKDCANHAVRRNPALRERDNIRVKMPITLRPQNRIPERRAQQHQRRKCGDG